MLRTTPPPEGICSSDPILVIDASLGNVVFPIPDAQRQFADINAFVNFAQNDLNATPIYDENGAPVGVKGRRFPQPERQDAAPST